MDVTDVAPFFMTDEEDLALYPTSPNLTRKRSEKRKREETGYDLCSGAGFEAVEDVPPQKRRRVMRRPTTQLGAFEELAQTLGIPVTIKTLSGKSVVIKVKPTERVSDVKGKLYRNEGIPPSQQRLIWNGKHMADDRLMSEYGVNSGDTIHLVLALRGGQI